MKRFATLVLLAGLWPASAANAADPDNLPAIPAPPASTHGGGLSVDVSGTTLPPRDRVGWSLPSTTWNRISAPAANPTPVASPTPIANPTPVYKLAPQAPPSTAGAASYAPTGPLVLPTGYKLAGAVPATCSGPACASPASAPEGSCRGSCYERFKAWLCFRPTTGDALPKLNPHPYVGPIAGTFPCGPTGCATGTCATGACATGTCDSGRFGGILAARGCKGGCVPPADDAIPGYRFAGSESPRVAAPAVQPAGYALPPGYTAYKPTVVTAAPVKQPVAKPAGDPLARPYTRP